MNNNLIEGINNLIEYRESLEENEYAYSMELESAKDKGVNLQKYFKKNYAINRKASQLSTPGELSKKYNEFTKKETFDRMVEKWLGFYNVKYNRDVINFNNEKGDSFKTAYSEYKEVCQEIKYIESRPKVIVGLFVPGIVLTCVAFILFCVFQVRSELESQEENIVFIDLVRFLIVVALGAAGVIPLGFSIGIPNKRRKEALAKEKILHEKVFKEYESAYYNALKKINLVENYVNKDMNKDIEKEYLETKKEAFNKYIKSGNILQNDMQMQILELDKTGFDCFKSNYNKIDGSIDLYDLCSKCKAISEQANNTDASELIKAREEAIKMLSNIKEQIQPTFEYTPTNNFSFDDIKSDLLNVKVNTEVKEPKKEERKSSSLYCITCNDKDKCPHLGNPIGFCYK